MIDYHDVLMVCGGLLVVAGVGFIYWPAAFMVAGMMLIVASILGAQAQSRARRKQAMAQPPSD